MGDEAETLALLRERIATLEARFQDLDKELAGLTEATNANTKFRWMVLTGAGIGSTLLGFFFNLVARGI